MNQYSENGEAVQVEIISGQLLFIDPIYFDDIAEVYEEIKPFSRFDTKKFIQLIEQKVFQYGGGALLGLKSVDPVSKVYELEIASIRLFNPDDDEIIEKEAIEKNITAFGLDSASFYIIDMANFDALIPILRSEDLFKLYDNRQRYATFRPISTWLHRLRLISSPFKSYVEKINGQIGNRGWAFVSSPGVEQGYEFEGDGSYFIAG
jgi:hypothetical protein